MITAEVKYPIDFMQSGKKFVLLYVIRSLHVNGRNSFLFFDAVKMYQFKAKDSEIKPYTYCLGNISKAFTVNNIFVMVEVYWIT